MAEPILAATGLWKSYGRSRGWLSGAAAARLHRPALVDVSISVMPGEILGVVGESGSGKSTLARCLALLERPDRGQVMFQGADLTRLTAAELRQRRRRIQTIFQDPYASLNPRLTVGDALAEVLRVHLLVPRSKVGSRVRELLAQVGMPEDAGARYPSDFSGGQRQRISIARALAAEPEVLIADEPVSALDVSIRAQVVNLLLELRERLRLAVIFIGHDLLLIGHIAQRVAVMLGGQIVELLPANVPLEAARHPYTQELLAAVPRLQPGATPPDRMSAELAGAMPVEGCPYWARCPYRRDPRCANTNPQLRERSPGHFVASFYDDALKQAPMIG